MPLRSNPRSTGDGLRLAREVGGALGNPRGGFHGHLVPAHVPLRPEHFVDVAFCYSEHALLFNLRGERFLDETWGDHLTADALLEQPEARGLPTTECARRKTMTPGRVHDPRPLEEPPYYVVETVPAITVGFTTLTVLGVVRVVVRTAVPCSRAEPRGGDLLPRMPR